MATSQTIVRPSADARAAYGEVIRGVSQDGKELHSAVFNENKMRAAVGVTMARFRRLLICGLAVLATAASADEPPPPQTYAVPIPDGQIAEAISKLDQLVEDTMAATDIPGIAVAVVHDGAVAYAKGFGVREVGKSGAVNADTVFQLASVSKSIGATVVAHQVGEGQVDWNTPVAELLPWFKLADPAATAMLTVGDLYAHRSGLPEHAGDDLEDLGYDRRAVLKRLSLVPLDGFRDTYAYTNFGLTAAAEAVAAAAGAEWETLSERVVYRLLGMNRTSSRFADYERANNRAAPHVRIGDKWQARFQRQPDAQSPAGGVSSSVNDMAKWMAMVLADGGALIPPEALLPALSPQSVNGPPDVPAARAGFYGYGFNVGVSPAARVMHSHSGAFALGAATSFYLIPSAGVGVVVLSNAAPIGAVEAIGLAFTDMVQLGEPTRDWLPALQARFAPFLEPFGKLADKTPPANPEPPRELGAYIGEYRNAYFGTLEIANNDVGLVLTIGPDRQTYQLLHWSGDRFVFIPFGENANLGSVSEVAFKGGTGRATAVTV